MLRGSPTGRSRAWFDHQVPITFHGAFAPART